MYIYLDIIKEFSCEMCGQCCRNDWQVTMDEESYRRNARLFREKGKEEEFSKAFIPITGKSELGEYAYIAKKAIGGCWFLAENHLCLLQGEAGHSHLDAVCQTYPRYPMNTARGMELTLSFSCPAVIKLASRIEPIKILRSEEPPMVILPDNYVVHVFPEQQSIYNPLHYYFEIEHHFLDIMQCRQMTIGERIQLLKETIWKIDDLKKADTLGQKLNSIIYTNYELMDGKEVITQQSTEHCTQEILMENFFVNFIFKKPFYLYGIQKGIELIEKIWQAIESVRIDTDNLPKDMEKISQSIMELELKYSHNRKSLLT